MSAQRKSFFGCPVCGFGVAGDEDACPRCGLKFEKGMKFECPFCSMIVDPASPKCPGCHVSFEEFVQRTGRMVSHDRVDALLTEVISTESRRVKEEDRRLSCPHCSWMLHGTEEKCPKCGASFSEDVCYQCPICASLVRFDAAKCEECGALFSQEGARPGAEVVQEPPARGPEPEEEPVMAPILDEPARAEQRPERETPQITPAREAAEPPEKEPDKEPEKEPRHRKLRTRKVKAKPR